MHGITSQVLLRSIVEISVNMNQCQYYGISHTFCFCKGYLFFIKTLKIITQYSGHLCK